MNLLVIGGSGFLSGTLARRALARGDRVWAVTRGQKPLLPGVTAVRVDRHDRAAFAQAVAQLSADWELVVDCIGYQPDDARQDLEVFRGRTGRLAFVSTDFVYDPRQRRFPQPEEGAYAAGGYGGNKRLAELEFERAAPGNVAWTILRPCHIYGPGSQLGCLPCHSRDPQLVQRLRDGRPLELVGGGHFLQQPILARDLADLLLSLPGSPHSGGQVYVAAGPEMIESRAYYQIIADLLGVRLAVTEVPVDSHLAAHPDAAPFLCHRIYDLAKLRASGLPVPTTPLATGLAEQVRWLIESAARSPNP